MKKPKGKFEDSQEPPEKDTSKTACEARGQKLISDPEISYLVSDTYFLHWCNIKNVFDLNCIMAGRIENFYHNSIIQSMNWIDFHNTFIFIKLFFHNKGGYISQIEHSFQFRRSYFRFNPI